MWSKGILKSVILISWQIEKSTHQAQIRFKSCSNVKIWGFTPDSNHVGTVIQKQHFIFFFLFMVLFTYSLQYGKYLQSSPGDLKDTSLFYTMSRSSYREVFSTPQGSCFYQLLNFLHWTPMANTNCSYYFVIFFHHVVCHGHYGWELTSLKDSVSWTVSEIRLSQICLTY